MHFLYDILLHVLLACCCYTHHVCHAYTYEPPGKDPVSIDKIRNSDVSTKITSDNFDELTKGKLVFIKFYSPYCPHCKEMAGAWNELATHYDNSQDDKNNNILIGSIDCTDAPKGKALCVRFKIMGLPTLLYGDASLGGIYLEEYGGDKTFADLKTHATTYLVPKCNPGNLDACSSDTRKEMEVYMAMSYETLDGKIKEIEGHEEDLKTVFKKKFAELQKKYDDILLDKELEVTKIKSNVKLIKEVMQGMKK